ncbi:MAG: hypothetical protein IJB97_04380 [Clostridia bacterium]|nr:hypothetical protein [Clostridia bacterium]
MLSCEKVPVRTKRGAPIKNKIFNPDIPLTIEEIKRKNFSKNQLPAKEIQANQTINPASKINKNPTHFTITVEKLNDQQKQLLIDFLKSL